MMLFSAMALVSSMSLVRWSLSVLSLYLPPQEQLLIVLAAVGGKEFVQKMNKSLGEK